MKQELREAVIERDREKCVNCRSSVGEDGDVHHIVPRGAGGADIITNLALLCRQCHDAIHDNETMAPTVQFASTGYMNSGSFSTFLQFIKQIPSSRFDSDSEVWRVPKADCERLEISIEDPDSDENEVEQTTTTDWE
jgi:Restriction endonuclease